MTVTHHTFEMDSIWKFLQAWDFSILTTEMNTMSELKIIEKSDAGKGAFDALIETTRDGCRQIPQLHGLEGSMIQIVTDVFEVAYSLGYDHGMKEQKE